MLSYCLIEPALVAVPAVIDDPDTIETWLATLIELGAVSRGDLGRYLLKPSNLDDALLSGERLPNVTSVRTMLSTNGLNEVYSAQDVWRTAVTLLSRLATIEALPADDVAIEIFSVQPELRSTADAHLKGCLVAMIEAMCCCRESQAGLETAIMSLPGIKGPLLVKGQIMLPRPGAAFSTYHQSIPIVEQWNEFLASVDFEGVWHRAVDAIDLRMALEAACASNRWSFTSFVFGAHFIDSLKRNAAWGSNAFAGTAFSTCLSVICGRALSVPFHGGVVNKRHSPQLSKDGGFLAWRARITKGGPGLRLMYWKSSASIEFARVGPKHELKID